MSAFTPADQQQLQALGLSPAEALAQLERLKRPFKPVPIDRPCTLGDFILSIDPEDRELLALGEAAAHAGRVSKFVPASGAASRMFQPLLKALEGKATTESTAILDALWTNLERFAFYPELVAEARERGLDWAFLQSKKDSRALLTLLLTEQGLDYAHKPKAVLAFHREADGTHTALQAHFLEAAAHTRDAARRCRLHLTVLPEHEALIREHSSGLQQRLGAQCGVHFEVSFSLQTPATHTIAADAQGRPFRTEDGRLLLRPGGHGALIHNLNALKGDLVAIKNIDNVVPSWLQAETGLWKKRLIGLCVRLEQGLHHHVALLQERASAECLEQARAFIHTAFGVEVPVRWDAEALLRWLNRPLRVCGVVRNTGEPGGGPFWVRDAAGLCTPQIVEQAQLAGDTALLKTFARATHFNPVDMVCSVRDGRGQPFDLLQYVDSEAYFVAQKSHAGQPLQALEWPGLWNGAMAFWNTVFVEVPAKTFNPVKTYQDWLRPEHQPR